MVTAEFVTLVLTSGQTAVCCPLCGTLATRVHSRYSRTLQDLPWGPLRVQLRLLVRRFFCANPTCLRKIFTEPLGGLAQRSARRTTRLRDALLATGWALGGQAGARQCVVHSMPVSGATLLTLLRRWGRVVRPTPRVLGVDDWSFQTRTAGTLLVDLERHWPIEVLLGSDEAVLSGWLLTHPGVKVIVRDRGASYLRGATKGAPCAQQVLDRWHLLKNLGEVLQKVLAHHVSLLRQAAQEAAPVAGTRPLPVPIAPPSPSVRPRKSPRRKPATLSKQRLWQLEMYRQVQALSSAQWSQGAIARQLRIHPHTVRKYLRMEHFVDQRHSPHPSAVEPYRAYLQERWSQGHPMIKTLWEELCAQGFTGSYVSVWHFTRQWIPPEASVSAGSALLIREQSPRTPWQAKWLLLRPPETLSEADASYCQALYDLRPSLKEAGSLARQFGTMVREHQEDQLDAWLDQASASPLQEVRRFALGLRAEEAAVRAACMEPWSTGQVEGQITRLKYLKRQMYGRAHLDLLRLRVLHSA